MITKEEVEKQGKSLACQFEQIMELGDGSDKEAPTTNPRKEVSHIKEAVGGDLHAGDDGN